MENSDNEMPHLGAIIKKYMTENRYSNSQCAVKMGVHQSQISKFLQNQTMQMDTFWKFCIALNHDFFSDILPKLPVYKTPEEDPRIKEMQMQIDIYKDLLRK